MQINNNMNNSTSFGKILKFENQMAKMFETSLFSCSTVTKGAYAEFLDTFAKSEPIKKFVSVNDVNIKFERNLDFQTEMVEMKVSIEDPSIKDVPPVIWQAKKEQYDEFSLFKFLTRKIADLDFATLLKGKRKLQSRQAETERRIIEHKEFIENKNSESKELDKKIQKSINSIINM